MNTNQNIQISQRKSDHIETISMVNTNLDFFLQNTYKPHRCGLNPEIMRTKADTYYALKFTSGQQTLPFKLNNSDSLILKLDNSEIVLPVLDVSRIGKKYSAYYRINYLDLIDIGNSDKVQVCLVHGDSVFCAEFSGQNILNYRQFNAKYILKSADPPVLPSPRYEQPWGFLSGGAGNLYAFWLAKYINFIKIGTGLSDFIAAGIGYVPFYYTEWATDSAPEPEPPPDLIAPGVAPVISWVERNQSSSSSMSLNLMYGFTSPIPIRGWSVEAGICFYYFIAANRWNDRKVRYPDGNNLTIIDSGIPYKGLAIGGFIQLGGLWFQYNSKKIWTAGLSIPIPWW